jgi:hypothetical protein
LVLVAVPAGKLEDVKKAQKPNTFILSATIWIENKQTEVAAFRKPLPAYLVSVQAKNLTGESAEAFGQTL